MLKSYTLRPGFAGLVALVAAVVTAGIAYAISWSPPMNLSQAQPIQSKDRVTTAAYDDDVVVIWANSQTGAGVTIARRQGESGPWEEVRPGTIIPGQIVWAPTIAHSGSEILAAWAEGLAKGGCDTKHKIVAYSIIGTATTRRTVKDNLYGPSTAPHIAVNASGWHMVFAGSDSEADCRASQHGLYYSFRAAGSQTWSVPTQIITHNAAFPTALQAGVSHPKVTTVPGSTAIHIVWEQYRKYRDIWDTLVDETSIWHASGVAAGSFAATRQRLSPTVQPYAVRPDIATGAAGRILVTWTQIIGSRASPSEQHIWFRSLETPTLGQLNEGMGPVYVNSNFPTFAGSSLVAQGDHLCAVWHGYYGSPGAGQEEVTVRCSQNGGASWQTPINVSESLTWLSIFPSVSIDHTGLLHFVWAEYARVDNAYEPIAVYYRNSAESSGVFLPLVTKGR
jgi:hypothetical protein